MNHTLSRCDLSVPLCDDAVEDDPAEFAMNYQTPTIATAMQAPALAAGGPCEVFAFQAVALDFAFLVVIPQESASSFPAEAKPAAP
jgi:hypothetical protein